jgi:hypothetical protein
MPKKKKLSLRDEIKQQVMVGIDGQERNISEWFEENDFDQSKDKKQIFVRHDALLRVAKRVFKGIKQKCSQPLGVPVKADDWCAVVKITYLFGSGHKISASADCRDKTANPGYKGYNTALAETRASARALRLALGIEMTSQEEITNIEDLVDRAAKEPAMEQQLMLIKKKFMKGEGKTLDDISKILGRSVVTLSELTRGEATEVLEYFHSK